MLIYAEARDHANNDTENRSPDHIVHKIILQVYAAQLKIEDNHHD